MLDLSAGRGRGQPKHPARKFRDQFDGLHRYYCAVALLMLAASKEARRQNRDRETQAIFREWFREVAEPADIGWRSSKLCQWFGKEFLKAHPNRRAIRSFFLLTTRGRRRQIL